MIQVDYRGHRGAVAGDDYHELWVVHKALELLDPRSDLQVITLEGLQAEDEGEEDKAWSGVDCTFYYGGDALRTCSRVEIVQVKYSSANPSSPWTDRRLAGYGSGKNSVISRLSQAFQRIATDQPEVVQEGRISIHLVSNQPMDPALEGWLAGEPGTEVEAELREASGLAEADFEKFRKALDFSDCNGPSRFTLRESIAQLVARHSASNSLDTLSIMLRGARELMVPERKGEHISQATILAWMGVADIEALLPCPSHISKTEFLIARHEMEELRQQMLETTGSQRYCLHGQAGCGKTTALQELRRMLPSGSELIVFDCYGGGSCLNSDAQRHRSRDAFLQLSNELASRIQVPMLVTQKSDLDYPRVFRKRLGFAAEVLRSMHPDALLVIAIDAADNSITAANRQTPPERSFVQDFVRLGSLPSNVRLLVTCQTGRLPELELPDEFHMLELGSFNLSQTEDHVRQRNIEPPSSAWIQDFHRLSSGVPRVQDYSLQSSSEADKVLAWLQPTEKDLDDIFTQQLADAQRKGESDQFVGQFCAALSELPRPIPVAVLSPILNCTLARIRDLCRELAPGVRLDTAEELVRLADEDFEKFLTDEAQPHLPQIQARIADYFWSERYLSPYPATHVAAALYRANRPDKILELLNAELPSSLFEDPILRRQVLLKRLKIGMRVSLQQDNRAKTVMALLAGARALIENETFENLLADNPDLAAELAPDGIREVLRDSTRVAKHGPLLVHRAATRAREGHDFEARQELRQWSRWNQRRSALMRDKNDDKPRAHNWNISIADISAEVETVLRLGKPVEAVRQIRSWRPREVAVLVASNLVPRLLMRQESGFVEQCISSGAIFKPWDLLLLGPLALAGLTVKTNDLLESAMMLLRRGLLADSRPSWNPSKPNVSAILREHALRACEIAIARGCTLPAIQSLLEHFAGEPETRAQTFWSHDLTGLDLALRSQALLDTLADRELTTDSFLPGPSKLDSDSAETERLNELRTLTNHFIRSYQAWAQLLCGKVEASAELKELKPPENIPYSAAQSHLLADKFSGMAGQFAHTISRLVSLVDLPAKAALSLVMGLIGNRSLHVETGRIDALKSLSYRVELHPDLIEQTGAWASAIVEERASAEDRLQSIATLTRFLLPISGSDAKAIFSQAVKIAETVDTGIFMEMQQFELLCKNAASSLNADERSSLATRIGSVAEDGFVRTDKSDGFPWGGIVTALSALQTGGALGAIARWDDEGLVRKAQTLPAFLQYQLDQGELKLAQVVALLPLLDEWSEELWDMLMRQLRDYEGESLGLLIEQLAQDDLLRYSRGRSVGRGDDLRSILDQSQGRWLKSLTETNAFHRAQSDLSGDVVSGDQAIAEQSARQPSVRSTDSPRFITTVEIEDWVAEKIHVGEDDSIYAYEAQLDALGELVAVADRREHLSALASLANSAIPRQALADTLRKRIKSWIESPAVEDWCKACLLGVVSDLLPELAIGLLGWWGESDLPYLLGVSQGTDTEKFEALVTGLEQNVDRLTGPTAFAVISLASNYVSPEEARDILRRLVPELEARLEIGKDNEEINMCVQELPKEAEAAVARFLFTFLSDVDLRVRWRAAHAIRRLASLGEQQVIDEVILLWDREQDCIFRMEGAPFYWLAARLWLVLTLDRIASETPSALEAHGRSLFETATKEDFPHILVQHFAASAARKLFEKGHLQLVEWEIDELAAVNYGQMDPVSPSPHPQFNPFGSVAEPRPKKARRFSFDPMDTLRYWYPPVVEAFSGLKLERFLDLAEEWIVDRWGVTDPREEWARMARVQRFAGQENMLWGHSHGSIPILERFWTHLEWHAMWCAAGSALREFPLVKAETTGTILEHLIRRNTICEPPWWLSDLHGPKPLERRFWHSPTEEIDTWIETIQLEDFLMELHTDSPAPNVVVASSMHTFETNFSSHVSVTSALVRPKVASSLVRALQTADSPVDYRVPFADDDLEIQKEPYVLCGWLVNRGEKSGLDEKDPWSFGVVPIKYAPSKETVTAMELVMANGRVGAWSQAESDSLVFSLENWSDTLACEVRQSGLSFRSSGSRLIVDPERLQEFLAASEMSLLVQIQISRDNCNYMDRPRKNEKSSHRTRIFLLRANGNLEDASGCIGTWPASSS